MLQTRPSRLLAVTASVGALLLCTCAVLTTRTELGRHATARSIRWLAGPPARMDDVVVFSPQSAEKRSWLQSESDDEVEDDGTEEPAPGASDTENSQRGSAREGLNDLAPNEEPPPPVDLVREMKRTTRPQGLPGVSYLLLLGTDKSRPRLRGRTDAIILIAFRDRDGAVAAFSVPRDLWVEIPDLRYARINAVARIGDLEYGSDKGLPLLKKVLELELGVRVDHHAVVDFAGFQNIVDALGGVEIEVPCPVMDCFWTHGQDQPCVPLQVEAGLQRMDGTTALMYARSRHGRGDFDRSRRQQAVIAAIVRQLRTGGLSGLRRAWELLSPYLETDLDLSSALYYASFALENDVKDLRGFSFAGSAMTRKFVTEDRKHVLLLDHERFDAALSLLFDRPLPSASPPKRCPEATVALSD